MNTHHRRRNNTEAIFSLEKLDQHLQVIAAWEIIAFLGHWQRIFGTWHPVIKQVVKLRIATIWDKKIRNKHAYFWCTILREILEANHYSLTLLCQDTHRKKSFWQTCLSMHPQFVMPLTMGKQLLWLHHYLRPELQSWK